MKKPTTFKAKLKIVEEFCKGCDYCIEFCPVDALKRSERPNLRGVCPPKLKDEGTCIACGLCERICPDLAICLER